MPFVQDTVQNEVGKNSMLKIEVTSASNTDGWNDTRSLTGQAEEAITKVILKWGSKNG
ncbi:hypothetical protein [Dictyobacter arantiisoli]|uniref:Uncharacterized protein n=1 Tax=Dictyobacter arantiisoli TaxID=2014874 RepID=A0A5A5TDI6_9CHLR|nr:hypothetical protein [Dictyobacter arantiisoli]GCF09600.1 hypothetical protein KDI_31640 [Dictyobacter arantiisoli]